MYRIFMERSAVFSDDRKYRYRLSRIWEDGDCLYFIMLNPSTANENGDDPTIRRCIGFARNLHFAGLHVLNLYALVSSDPHKLVTEHDAIGADNDQHLRTASKQAKKIIVAWGNFGFRFSDRVNQVLDILKDRDIYCLGETEQGQPRHPLYVPKFQPLEVYKEMYE